MAYDTFLRDWVIDGENDEAALRRYLNEVPQQYGIFMAFFISENTRRYYHFIGTSKVMSEDEPRDVWFFRVRNMAAAYEINVDLNQQHDDKITFFFNHHVRDYAGKFIGIIGVGLESDTMAAVMDRYSAVFGRHVYFAERSGRITLHPDLEVAYRRNLADMPGMAAIADKVLQSDRGAFEYQTKDGTLLLTTRYIPELDWILMVEQRESIATAGAGTGLIRIVLIGIATIAFTTLAIAWAINRVQGRLEQMATLGPLTGLYNLQVFDIALTKTVERARRNNLTASLILIDLDHFKPTNDRFGHLVGDRILKAIARLLQHSVRRSDVHARWGGEEFAVLMENCGELEAKRAAELLRQRIADDLRLDDLPDARTTPNLGVTTLGPRDTVDDLFARADAALYAAKKAGLNRVAGSDGAVEMRESQREADEREPQPAQPFSRLNRSGRRFHRGQAAVGLLDLIARHALGHARGNWVECAVHTLHGDCVLDRQALPGIRFDRIGHAVDPTFPGRRSRVEAGRRVALERGHAKQPRRFDFIVGDTTALERQIAEG